MRGDVGLRMSIEGGTMSDTPTPDAPDQPEGDEPTPDLPDAQQEDMPAPDQPDDSND